jgi:hypothetical protein
VDWLVEVGEEYKLQTETLFLAVSYIDRLEDVFITGTLPVCGWIRYSPVLSP